ncbi:hypothetical protein [Hymenobacter canadensis]|uniref:STAS/SEC14 domain-containing protein n=1 Tax=Hymenobacter canadensis TaxID=2999067 RepID=A0ABY7LUM8_9BACT|nr:hypothetical protein [Hymenobacter canadensis]WBA44103.1 hypothetical protein O3303_19635 [Hymenobacter canadensis]
MNHTIPASAAIALVSCLRGGYVALKWHNVAATDEQLQAVYEQALLFMQSHRTPRLLSDHRVRPPLSLDLQQWLRDEWIPRAIREAGYSHCAIVESTSPLGRLAARAIGMAVTPTLTARHFETVEPAQAWLLQFATAASDIR